MEKCAFLGHSVLIIEPGANPADVDLTASWLLLVCASWQPITKHGHWETSHGNLWGRASSNDHLMAEFHHHATHFTPTCKCLDEDMMSDRYNTYEHMVLALWNVVCVEKNITITKPCPFHIGDEVARAFV